MSVIPQTPTASRGLRPLSTLPELCNGPAGDPKRSPDTSPTHAPPNHKSWIRPCYLHVITKVHIKFHDKSPRGDKFPCLQELITDRQTDGQSDYYKASVSRYGTLIKNISLLYTYVSTKSDAYTK
jgi:hypothetical protein